MRSRSTSIVFLSVCLTVSLSGACDSTFIDPFDNGDRFFSVYGYLDQTKNFQPGAMHTLRVVPITRRAERIQDPSVDQAQIDARVFSINTLSGQETEWTHALELLDNGHYGHIFRARFPIDSGQTYRLEVRRSDGIMTSAETTVPALSNVLAERPLPVRTAGDQQVFQDILLPEIAAIWDITVIYRVRSPDCFTANTTIHRFPYGSAGERTSRGWNVTTAVSQDMQKIATERPEPNLFLCAMGIEVKVLDPDWPLPSDGVDLASLSLQSRYSNVTHGYGFWGSIGLLQNDWQISDSLAVYLGQTLPVR